MLSESISSDERIENLIKNFEGEFMGKGRLGGNLSLIYGFHRMGLRLFRHSEAEFNMR